MTVNSQVRNPLSEATQQAAGLPVAAMVSQQYAVRTYTTDFTLDVDFDRFIGHPVDGDIAATVPLATKLVKGKPYIIEKKGSSNTLTVEFSGDDQYGGETSIDLANDGDALAIISDGTTLKRAFPSETPGVAPGGSLSAAANLSDLDDAAAARENLDVNEVYLTARLSLVGTDADEIRLQSPVDGNVSAVYSDQSKGPIATGAATTTLTVGGLSPTANTLTHAIAEAAGTKKTMSPTGSNTAVVVGTEIRLAITGTNDAAGSAAGYTIVIARPAVTP